LNFPSAKCKLALIGFELALFFRCRQPVYFHKHLSNKRLRQLVPIQIGFVFSNSPPEKLRIYFHFSFCLFTFAFPKIGFVFSTRVFNPQINLGAK